MAFHPGLVRLGFLLLFFGVTPAALAELPGEKTVPVGGKAVKLVLAGIPAGTFAMGTDPSAPRFQRDEGPLTVVHITRPFWLGRTEVTQEQWESLGLPNKSFHSGKDRPVTNITWEQAMEFCRMLTRNERRAGRLPEGYVYTLPTEAQWEYACRAGESGDYAGELDDLGWYSGNSEGETHPVGQKRPNAWGLYDMHGNVLEWCRDWYGSYAGGERADPKGVPAGSVRVIRGGSWGYGAVFCRSAYRVRLRPDSRWVILGFRVALSPADPKPWWDFRTDPADMEGPVTADTFREKH
jgi:formylglycine-generating enzyme required for sulfatase activity